LVVVPTNQKAKKTKFLRDGITTSPPGIRKETGNGEGKEATLVTLASSRTEGGARWAPGRLHSTGENINGGPGATGTQTYCEWGLGEGPKMPEKNPQRRIRGATKLCLTERKGGKEGGCTAANALRIKKEE